ncbi:MAG TPA: hypothetical protein PLH94_00910 [Fimbriimonadaceae bacterium]|nr:hypothetical protein [Fimbriimonadaceae bacterium]
MNSSSDLQALKKCAVDISDQAYLAVLDTLKESTVQQLRGRFQTIMHHAEMALDVLEKHGESGTLGPTKKLGMTDVNPNSFDFGTPPR